MPFKETAATPAPSVVRLKNSFIFYVFQGGNAVTTAIKRSGIESRLMEFFPPTGNQQTEENFIKTFKGKS